MIVYWPRFDTGRGNWFIFHHRFDVEAPDIDQTIAEIKRDGGAWLSTEEQRFFLIWPPAAIRVLPRQSEDYDPAR
jgi:hypothetical protein